MRTGIKRVAFPIAAAALAGLAYLTLHDNPVVDMLEGETLDWRLHLRGTRPAPAGTVIVAIDDRTLATHGRWPLRTALLADGIRRIDAAGAAALGIDLLFFEPDPADDGALREALAATPRDVLAAVARFDTRPGMPVADPRTLDGLAYAAVLRDGADPGMSSAVAMALPLAPLRREASVGHVNVPVDAGGSVRHVPLAISVHGRTLPALPVELARLARGLDRDDLALAAGRHLLLGGQSIAIDRRSRLALNFHGPAGTIETHSFADLLAGRVGARELEGRAVLLGATALGIGDTFDTTFARTMHGVEILATATANLLHDEALRRTDLTLAIDLLATMLLAWFGWHVARLPSALAGGAVIGIVMAGWFAAATAALVWTEAWLAVFFPASAAWISSVVSALFRFGIERRQRRTAERERGNLARHMSPLVADRIARDDLHISDDEERPAAILFVDLAGFTDRSRRMGPAATARFLRTFHAHVERAALAHGGFLEQFTGDGAMIIFGLEDRGADDAADALACALELADALSAWSVELIGSAQAPLSFGVGLHYGPVVIAELGGERQRQLTAAGDTVNVASRLQALTRELRVRFVLSASAATVIGTTTRRHLLAGFAPRTDVTLRGRDGLFSIWAKD